MGNEHNGLIGEEMQLSPFVTSKICHMRNFLLHTRTRNSGVLNETTILALTENAWNNFLITAAGEASMLDSLQ